MEVQPQATPYETAPAATVLDPYAAPATNPVAMPAAAPGSLVAAVQAGHRFYVIPYVFSVVILTFRRSMGGVREVSDHHWPVMPLAGAALVTSLLGWWGFPWGIVFSIAALVRLWNGGKDVTLQMLQQVVGPAEAKRILDAAPKPVKPPSFWLVRLVVLAGLSPVFGLIFLIGQTILEVH